LCSAVPSCWSFDFLEPVSDTGFQFLSVTHEQP
jgi:hypothetical protein